MYTLIFLLVLLIAILMLYKEVILALCAKMISVQNYFSTYGEKEKNIREHLLISNVVFMLMNALLLVVCFFIYNEAKVLGYL